MILLSFSKKAMSYRIVYVKPKSDEAQDFFNFIMRKIHSCKLLEKDDDRLLVSPIQLPYKFWIQKKNDSNWELIK
jgi:hypothetical protein